MPISSFDVRRQFLDYFKRKGHQIVPSSPLLPKDDPTLLFVNAGMVQFKDVFTGQESRPYKRAASSQKCVRAGGKHNDLENVGRTARHHTFFEMLGNFSFGDYFKEDACAFAWEFLTKDLAMDKSRLSVTVFGGESGLPADEEAEKIWQKVGVPASKISRLGAKDNFWAMGDTGPCGPCTEIHYDRSDIKNTFGGDDAEGDRIMEFWNLVFMQFERKADGKLIPLPAPSVDTGMGLERLCTILNGKNSNYDTDLLAPFVDLVAGKCGKTYRSSDSEDDVSFRVIADHCRTTSFLIADGVLPSNESRGYVLRRIMRRAIRHGARLGFDKPFFHNVCDEVISRFGSVYPELNEARSLIGKVVYQEEEIFRRTLTRGLQLFFDATKNLSQGQVLSGDVVFKLHETYGFPPDLTTVLAAEKKLEIDWKTFDSAKLIHEKASASELGLAGVEDVFKALREKLGPTRFVGDHEYHAPGKIISLLKDGNVVDSISAGESGALLLDQTTFYGESGGQVGDTGVIKSGDALARVTDTKKIADLHVHLIKMEHGTMRLGDVTDASVDEERREHIRRHHSVTHLLHSALRQVLGSHVTQKGSLVAPDRLRFDFSHFEPMTAEQTKKVEDLVNDWVLENADTHVEQTTYDDAKKKGALALFGEKYGDKVRMVAMGPHSTELCGGTHSERTGDIGLFRITGEGPLAQGVRRLEAVAGKMALEYTQKQSDALKAAATVLAVPSTDVVSRLNTVIDELKAAQRKIDQLAAKETTARASDAAKGAKTIKGVKVFAENMGQVQDTKDMQVYADKLRDQLGSGIIALGSHSADNKCTLLVALTKDLTTKYHAGKMVSELGKLIDGRGGGRPDFAQAGGTRTDKIDEALQKLEELL